MEKIGSVKNPDCNKTHLDVERAEDRGIIHRDYLSHMLRWTHAIKHCKYKGTVLDVGCGTGMMAQVLYVNKFRPEYIGVDIRKKVLEEAEARKLPINAKFIQMDITQTPLPATFEWASLVTCFEVVEHIPEDKLDFVLGEIARCIARDGTVLLSTPNYDGKNKAGNHLKEFTVPELRTHLEKFFTVKKMYGTFASQKDIEPVLTEGEKKVWENLKEYYDSNLFSVIFAPLHPEQSRNIMWVLEKKIA